MIKRIYIDNYKAAVNFELKPEQENLWFGSNGSGKTTILEVLSLLRDFIIGARRTNAFGSDTKTNWIVKNKQTFELDLQGDKGLFSYKLVMELADDRSRNRIASESLTIDNHQLYMAEIDEDHQFAAHLFNDSYNEGAVLGFDWTQSGLSLVQERKDNHKLIEFRKIVERMIIARINPFSVDAECTDEASHPGYMIENFVAWYNQVSQEKQGLTLKLFKLLSNLMQGFDSFSLIKSGEERKLLKACFIDKQGNEQQYRFDRLSDGQRVLIILYSLITFLGNNEKKFIIILDEPENFVSLEEIQPWLNELSDACTEKQNQYILISHHPETLDQLARSNGIQFFRDGSSSPIRTRVLPESDEPLSVSKLVARGWLNE
jgi:predicted ATPase